MKKSINGKDDNGYSKTLGEITLIPQSNEIFEKAFAVVLDGASSVPALTLGTWMCSISVGGTNILTVHAIPGIHIEMVAAWAETYLEEFLELYALGECVEAALNKNGYSL